MQRRHGAICAALVIVTAIPVLAQGPALELQLGGGFLLADSDLSSLSSVEAGVVLWWSNSWGFAMDYPYPVGTIGRMRLRTKIGLLAVLSVLFVAVAMLERTAFRGTMEVVHLALGASRRFVPDVRIPSGGSEGPTVSRRNPFNHEAGLRLRR